VDKNTIWAIVLSTVVIIASWLLLPKIFPGLSPMGMSQAQNEVVEETNEPEELNIESEENTLESEESTLVVEDAVEIKEETFKVETDLVEVVLTNRGGDIISYKLKGHKDTDTDDYVQLSDNISNNNRTMAISFGPIADNKEIVNDLFEVEKINDYTYFFKKTINVNGKPLVLGKQYEFKDGEYVFKLDVKLYTPDGKGLNIEDTSYTLRTSPQIGPHFNAKQNRYENRQFLAYNGSKTKKIILGQNKLTRYEKNFVWGGIAGKYFVELVIPNSQGILNAAFHSSLIEVNNYANAQAMFERKAFATSEISDSYFVYFGPRNEKELKRYNVAENNAWGLSGYRVNQALQTYDWLKWLETILKFIMELLYKVVHNWGAAIIILTILLKVIMFPLSKKQSLGTLKMQELQPKMQAIQAKYKDDQQRMQMETQKLYKEAGYNPASGCLPMVFQFLILFAMYDLFNNYFEFRGAMFIPGWIPDLSVGDSVYTFTKEVPVLSRFLGNDIRILPVIYVFTQLLSGKITQYGQAAGQSQASMKFMMYGMPLIFFFIFYNAPSGLLLYWLTSNILQIVQQIIINKMMKQKKEEIAGGAKKNQKTLPPKAKRK